MLDVKLHPQHVSVSTARMQGATVLEKHGATPFPPLQAATDGRDGRSLKKRRI